MPRWNRRPALVARRGHARPGATSRRRRHLPRPRLSTAGRAAPRPRWRAAKAPAAPAKAAPIKRRPPRPGEFDAAVGIFESKVVRHRSGNG